MPPNTAMWERMKSAGRQPTLQPHTFFAQLRHLLLVTYSYVAVHWLPAVDRVLRNTLVPPTSPALRPVFPMLHRLDARRRRTQVGVDARGRCNWVGMVPVALYLIAWPPYGFRASDTSAAVVHHCSFCWQRQTLACLAAVRCAASAWIGRRETQSKTASQVLATTGGTVGTITSMVTTHTLFY